MNLPNALLSRCLSTSYEFEKWDVLCSFSQGFSTLHFLWSDFDAFKLTLLQFLPLLLSPLFKKLRAELFFKNEFLIERGFLPKDDATLLLFGLHLSWIFAIALTILGSQLLRCFANGKQCCRDGLGNRNNQDLQKYFRKSFDQKNLLTCQHSQNHLDGEYCFKIWFLWTHLIFTVLF